MARCSPLAAALTFVVRAFLAPTLAAATWVGCSTTAPASGVAPGTGADDASASHDGPTPTPADDAAATLPDATARADSSASDDGAVPSTPDCVTYCTIVQKACSVDYPQFSTMNACLEACAFYPPGVSGGPSVLGNTLECRTQHARSAVFDTGHCHHAGALGFGGCGYPCEGFCQLAMGWCAGSASGAPFASAAACATECEAFGYAPARPDGTVAFDANGPATGNTIDCRAYQLIRSLVSAADRDTYCPHVATLSATCR